MAFYDIRSSLVTSLIAGSSLLAIIVIAPVKNTSEPGVLSNAEETETIEIIPKYSENTPADDDFTAFSLPVSGIDIISVTPANAEYTGEQTRVHKKLVSGEKYRAELYHNTMESIYFQTASLPLDRMTQYNDLEINLGQNWKKSVSVFKPAARELTLSNGLTYEQKYFSASVKNRRNMILSENYRSGPEWINRQNAFQYDAKITPLKGVKLATSLFDAVGNESAVDAAKFGFTLDLDNMIFNMKYTYLTEGGENNYSLKRSLFKTIGAENIYDEATLGLTVFLDKNKKYAIFVGNNIFNPLTPVNRGKEYGPAFTASFRGRTAENYLYFLNFQNQAFRDHIYYSQGYVKLPVGTTSMSDFSTTLGLEKEF